MIVLIMVIRQGIESSAMYEVLLQILREPVDLREQPDRTALRQLLPPG